MFNDQRETRSSSVDHNLSDSTLDSYNDFKNHLLNINEPPDNFEDNTKNFLNNKQDTPQGLKFNGLLSDVQGIKNSNKAGLNKKIEKDKGFLPSDVSTKGKPTKVNSRANGVGKKLMTRNTSRSMESNVSGGLSNTEVVPSKKSTKTPKTVQFEKSEVNDTAVSIFLKKFDHEMAKSIGQPVNNLVNDSAPFPPDDLLKSEHNNLLKRPNPRSYKKLPKRRCADQSQRTVAQLLREEDSFSEKKDFDSDDSFLDKDFQIDHCDSTLNESNNVDNKKNSRTRRKVGFSEIGANVSVFSEADSIASNTSRYGRVRKSVPKYINATMFGGTLTKSTEMKQMASTLINSHKCKSKSSKGFGEASNISLDQFDLLSPIHKKSDSSEFKKPANQITSSKNGSNHGGFRSRAVSNTPRKSSLIDDDKENQNLHKSPPRNKTTSPKFDQITPLRSGNKIANKLNYNRAMKSSNETLNKNYLPNQEANFEHHTFDGAHSTSHPQEEININKPVDINNVKRRRSQSLNSTSSSKSKKILIHQNIILQPPNRQKKPVEYVKPASPNLLPKTLQSNVSHGTFQTTNKDFVGEFDDLGTKPDPNKINCVVNDEVVNIKWYSPTPDLDSVLNNGNVYYSMTDLKSFYTNVKVGYLKIEVGHRKLMQVLRDCIMLYFVERGEAVFRVTDREITGQVGSTFFIPLGFEHTITNSKTEDLILKFIKMSPTILEVP